MNQARRKEIEKLCNEFNIIDNGITGWKERLESLKEQFEMVRDAEQEYIDNMPESLHNSEKHDIATNSVTEMETLMEGIESMIETIDNMPNSDDLLNVI